MHELILKVHTLRLQHEEAKQRLKEAQERFREEHAALFAEVYTTSTQLEDAEGALRVQAVEVWARTGEKHVAPGVTVALRTVLDVDEQEALRAVMERKLYSALKLDKRAYMKLRKAEPSLPGEISQLAFARVASDLSAAVKEITGNA